MTCPEALGAVEAEVVGDLLWEHSRGRRRCSRDCVLVPSSMSATVAAFQREDVSCR